jgi:hypothetical protein
MKKLIILGTMAALVIGVTAYLLRPVCVPLGQDNLSSFNIPATQRMAQRDLYLTVWQEKGGQWSQCKTYLTRLLT